MDWRAFSLDVLADLAPGRFLEARLRPTARGFEAGGAIRRWDEFRQIHVIASGKPAASQAQALMTILRRFEQASSRIGRALAVTRDGYGSSTDDVEVFHASHPLPDERSLAAGELVTRRLEAIAPEDLAVLLISGGSSSLVESLREPYTLEDLRRLNQRLLDSGASIFEINAERKRMSRLKGGGWLEHCRAGYILNLVSCDVPSGDTAVVGSGPATREPAITEVLCDGRDLVEAACGVLRKRGIAVEPILPLVDCSVESAVELHLERLESALRAAKARFALVSGGEAPVDVRGTGRGGRNTEFVLRMADALWLRNRLSLGDHEIEVAAMASDGTDGPTDASGGWLTREKMKGREGNARECLSRNDSLSFLEECGTVLRTGPTGVNLMDLRVLVIDR